MFKNNMKIALRSLRKRKLYTAVTLTGLTAGIAAVLLIFRMVSYELSFNKSFSHYDRIVRVVMEETRPEEGKSHVVCTPIPAMDAIEQNVSQFEAMSRVKEFWVTVTLPNPAGGAPVKKFNLGEGETALFTEPDFFRVFDLEWLSGDPATALEAPSSIVLTKSWAEKCFDDWKQANGQVLMFDNVIPVTVTGVVEDLPVNTDFNVPFFASYGTLKANPRHFFYSEDWGNCSSNDQLFALLGDPSQMEAANEVLASIGKEEYHKQDNRKQRKHVLQPLSDLHFNEELGHSGTHRISKTRLRVLSFIGVLILVMACFNFINLATAHASLRAREVGVRKTLGSHRGQLIGQFISETGLIVLVALVIGVNLALFASPYLGRISDVPPTLPFLSDPTIWIFLAVTACIVTLLAGLYPALVLAGFKPVQALQNQRTGTSSGGGTVRKSLVVMQFVIAQALIVGAIITLLQLDYIRSRDLGFRQDLVYTFNINSDSLTVARQNVLKQRLLQIPTVEAVSLNSDQPLSGNTWMNNFRYGSRPEDEPFGITLKFCDEDYLETYSLEMAAGKWYAPSDTIREGVVNTTLVRKLGLANPAEVVGQELTLGSRRKVKITGVVEDFHTHTLHQEHQPLLLTTRKAYYWDVGVKIRPDDLAATTASIRQTYDEILPEQVFEGRFLDEMIADFYTDENRLADTCKGFGLLAILIACLGLFGLAAHAAAQRIKEVGIRKVLGATTGGIVILLSKDFLKLVVIALVIASPLAWYVMDQWLQDFAYRIDIKWWIFAVAGMVAIAVAFLTVGYQSVRAALANPVESLKNE